MGSVRGRDGAVRLLYFDQGRRVDARDRPDPAAPVIAQFVNDEAQAYRGRNGSPHRPFVFDRVPGWFQIARNFDRLRAWVSEERLWIEDSAAWRYTPVTDDAEREQFANDSWGREFDAVRVIGFRQAGDQAWVEVELMTHSICDSTDHEPSVLQRGWMPHHGASGEATLWFAARGC